MKKDWISPKIIIGNIAIGDYYYKRDLIEKEILDAIHLGIHVLMASPRRVGKTSVLQSIERCQLKGYKIIFENIQGIVSEQKFYKKLYELILQCLSKFENTK